MKKTLLFLGFWAAVAACQSSQTEQADAVAVPEQEQQLQATAYGETISPAEVKAVEQVPALLQGKDSVYLALRGTVLESCTKKGCWMTVDLGNGENMRVSFKDYGFFVPKDLSGEEVLMQGILKKEVSSIEDQRHYAEDAGKTPEEIAAIQQADTAYTFEAVGVQIWPKRQ